MFVIPRGPEPAPHNTRPAHAGHAAAEADIAGSPPGDLQEAGLWRRTFASLSVREYRIYFFGQGVSLVGTWMRITAQGWLVYELTGSKLLLGTVTALGHLPLFVFASVAGAMADRFPKRRLLLLAQAAMMLVSLSVAILVLSGNIRVWHLMVSSLLIGTAFAVDLPTRQSFYIHLVGRRDLLNAIALNSAAFNAARIVGPAAAGLIMATLGIAACFFADAASYVAVLASLLLLRVKEPVTQPAGKSHWQMLRQGFTYVRETRVVRILLSLLAVTCVFGWSYVALIPAYARDVLGLSETGYGYLMAVNGVGALAGALFVAGRGEKRRPRQQVFAGLWVMAVALGVFSLARVTWLAGLALAVAGAGLIVFLSTANTQIQLVVPDSLRGRVMGVWGLVFGGGLPLGSFVLGAVAQKVGVQVALGTSAVLLLLVSVMVFVSLPKSTAAREVPSGGRADTAPASPESAGSAP